MRGMDDGEQLTWCEKSEKSTTHFGSISRLSRIQAARAAG